jgi:tyramine---L-glutamate ligase
MRLLFGEYLSGLAPAPPDPGLLAQGLAMRNAVLAELLACAQQDPRLQLCCAVSPFAPLPAGLARVQQRTPRAGEPAEAFVQGQAALHDAVWLIAPETDGILARLSQAVPPARWLGCNTASIHLASSKAATTALLHAAGVLTPRAFDDGPAWVVKPDDGVGASDARRHVQRADAQADLARRLAAGRPSVLEPWVEGPAMSLSLLCSGGRAELLSVNRQSIAIAADGALVEGSVEALLSGSAAAPDLHGLAQGVAAALPGLFGLVGIDFVQHPRRGAVLIEVNPRVTSAYAGTAGLLRRNLARAVLDLLAARRAGSPPAR